MSEFPRQPQPVKIILQGHRIDVDNYMRKIKRIIEGTSYDHVTGLDIDTTEAIGVLTIHPGAVNE